MKQIIVRRYQLRAPVDWTSECEDQLRKQTRFWNRLVEIDREYRARYRGLLSAEAGVAEAEAAWQALADERAALTAQRKSRRRAVRGGIATPDIDFRLSELRPLIADAATGARAARKAAKAGIREAVSSLNDEHFEAAKRARQEANRDGLWWGNANAVFRSFQTARGSAMRDGTELQFHAYRGEGRITNQIQGGGMPVARLFAGTHPQAQTEPVAEAAFSASSRGERKQAQRTTLSATVYARGRAERKNATWPMLLSRPIPDDAQIKEIVVTRRRIASHARHSAVFLATREVPDDTMPAPSGPAIAIDLGWRRLADGLRVGTVLADGDLHPTHVVCPQRTLDDIDWVEQLRARRDELRNAVLAQLTRLDWRAAPPELAELGARLRLTPASAPGRIATLAMAWRGHDWRLAERDAAEAWRKADKRLWEEEANLRDKALYRRLDAYRKAAKAIAERAGAIILEKFDIAAIARLETPAGDETEQVPAMRRYRTLAAPGELRRWIVTQAAKRGVAIHYHEGASNDPHWACGTAHAVPGPAVPRRHCPRCAACYDIDENACRNMLAAYNAGGPEARFGRPPLAARARDRS